MNIAEVFRYVGGASCVYLVMAACGDGGGGATARRDGGDVEGGGPTEHDGAVGRGGASGSANGDDASLRDARPVRDVDLGDAIRNPVRDARAQDASRCGECSVSGVVRVTTADTDPAQYFEAEGTVGPIAGPVLQLGTGYAKAAEGPLYLSTALGGEFFYVVDVGQSCTPDPASTSDEGFVAYGSGAPTVGDHFRERPAPNHGYPFIPAGRKLCARATSPGTSGVPFTIIGFRPYS